MGIPPKKLSGEALTYLQNYHWEGNIRELENFVRYILSTVDGNIVGVKEIPNHLIQNEPENRTATSNLATDEKSIVSGKEFNQKRTDIPFADYTWAELDKAYVSFLLKKNNWVITRAANDAGVNRSTFDSRIKKLGIKK
jgi:DNA-binding NtrC family response regulator